MNQFMQHAELELWSSLTTIMQQSTFIQKSMRHLYPIVEGLNFEKTIKTFFIAGIASISLGWIVSFILYLAKL